MAIYFSSGTTGTPKAIVHGVGPLLLSLSKENIYHHEIGPNDTALQYTTTGWIMFLASISHLHQGARAVLYDGSPLFPDPAVLLKIMYMQKVTVLGTSPRWMFELMSKGIVPRQEYDLSKLRLVTSTGMVLPEQAFEWFYDKAFPRHVRLSNMSGGTDIAGNFVLGNPIAPVHAGGFSGGCLGTPMAVFDSALPEGSEGYAMPNGLSGELVATSAFPNMPLYFWGDEMPAPGPKYRDSYFSRFKNAWSQGDFCVIHEETGNVSIL
ncbi:hypothetical protein K4F52_010202, partial [Lecanicillium sp. MT-2017a]